MHISLETSPSRLLPQDFSLETSPLRLLPRDSSLETNSGSGEADAEINPGRRLAHAEYLNEVLNHEPRGGISPNSWKQNTLPWVASLPLDRWLAGCREQCERAKTRVETCEHYRPLRRPLCSEIRIVRSSFDNPHCGFQELQGVYLFA